MNTQSINLLDLVEVVIKYLSFLTVLVTGFFFLNQTSEFYEVPKFLILLVLTGILLILWALRCVLDRKISLVKTPLDVPFLLLIVTFANSMFFATSKSLSLIGNLPKIHGGLASMVLYILLYFIIVSNLRKISIVKQIAVLIVASAALLSIFSLCNYFGLNVLGFDLSKAANFTPTGSSFSTVSLILLALPFPLITILRASQSDLNLKQELIKNIGGKTLLSILLGLFTITLVLLSNLPTSENLLPVGLIGGILVFGLAILTSPQKNLQKNGLFLALPLLAALIVGILSFVPGLKSPLYKYGSDFPREIQLPFSTSWKISVSAFRDAPFWGSGPASYLTDFTQYKPIEFNNHKYWNVRFDSAYNEYLQILATLGAPGIIVLLLITGVFLSLAIRGLASDQSILGLSLSISGIIFFVILALHGSTLITWVIGSLILASFMTVHKVVTKQVSLGIATKEDNSVAGLNLKFEGMQEIFLVAVLFLVGAAYFFSGKFALADYHHRLALNAVTTGQGLEVYNQLLRAKELNPYSDLYRTDLAQTNFALANAIAINKGPTEASPSGSLTEQDRQNIQTLLTQAIAEGQAATTINPNNPIDWEILAAIYRQISGVAQNALSFSLDAYGHAVQRDPLNPILRLNLGGIYYSVKNYDLAIRFFTDSVNLKPDYANGYYNLAVAFRDKGDLKSAIAAAEKTVSVIDRSSPDYQTSSNLLAELKKQDAELTQKGASDLSANPTASALQNKNLPKVLDLPPPQKIATPEAIKKQK